MGLTLNYLACYALAQFICFLSPLTVLMYGFYFKDQYNNMSLNNNYHI